MLWSSGAQSAFARTSCAGARRRWGARGVELLTGRALAARTAHTQARLLSVTTPCRDGRPCASSQQPAAPPAPGPPAHAPAVEPAPLPVAAPLVEELRIIVAAAPRDTWCPVADAYASLPTAVRRQHVRPHRTLLRVLQLVKEELGIMLSQSGVFYAIGSPPPETAIMKSSSSLTARGENSSSSNGGGGGCEPAGAPGSIVHRNMNPSVPSTSAGDTADTVDFYYDVGLHSFPAPPSDFDVTPSSLASALDAFANERAVLSVRDFVSFLPPFFVPLACALANMPGYTEAHVDSYLSTSKAMEMVRIGGVKYIRLYGGYAKIRLDGCEAAEEAFAKFKPKRSLVPAFAKAFNGIEEQWMPLKLLLSRADPAAVSQLPMEGPAAITYFAQMQDVFAFSVSNDGVSSSVLLRRPGFGGLECETTPTPKTVNFILHRLPTDAHVDVRALETQLSPPVRAELAEYYDGSLPRFFSAHAPIFSVSEDGSVVMRTSYKRRLYIASLPLEEQLRLATEQRDKRRIRTLRRRIAFRDNPSHPFHDPDNLALEVAKYLPRRGFVPVKTFLKQQVPDELLFFMPMKVRHFFQNYPQYFQQFEYQQAGTWAVSRPGQPMPRGVIRASFSEADLVRLIAEYLQQRGPRSCTTVYLNLPHGAQEVVKKKHGGVFYLVGKYPQYFNVVLGSDSGNAQSSAVVHLMELPTVHLVATADADSDGDEHNEEKQTSSGGGGTPPPHGIE